MVKQAHEASLPAVELDPARAEPLHRQLYFGVRRSILDGRLRPGLRLPSTRRLAVELQVSRNTVLAAFEQLAAEGYLESRTGAGSFVSRRLPDEAGEVDRLDHGASDGAAPPSPSRRGAALAALRHVPGRRRPLAPGVPELDRFPFDVWSRLLARRWRKPTRELLIGIDPAGFRPLRGAIADYLSSARAVGCRPEQVIITSGTAQALDLASRVLIDPGDAAWVEEPGYPATTAALLAAGARVVPVPVDDEGLSVVVGQALEPTARLACVSPSHQFPLGVTMSLKRRLELMDWARDHEGFIVEDDYDSEYRYAGRPLASLQGLDRSGRVIYVGTFSKVMFPGLRVGYMVVPDGLLDAFLAVRSLVDAHPPSIAQPALADFIGEGHLGSHIRRMRLLHAERQAALLEAVRRHLDGALQVTPAAAGMHLVGRLDPAADDQRIASAASELGVEAPALSAFYDGPPSARGLLLGYAGVASERFDPLLERLARAVDGVTRLRTPGSSARP
ncbi:MAG: PLP-dependent aminotransferase family protein [Geminicoccaceae bacterium]|nr:PLP-dependent aminotransferase family protein [Geminicoccaceae bacterium]